MSTLRLAFSVLLKDLLSAALYTPRAETVGAGKGRDFQNIFFLKP